MEYLKTTFAIVAIIAFIFLIYYFIKTMIEFFIYEKKRELDKIKDITQLISKGKVVTDEIHKIVLDFMDSNPLTLENNLLRGYNREDGCYIYEDDVLDNIARVGSDVNKDRVQSILIKKGEEDEKREQKVNRYIRSSQDPLWLRKRERLSIEADAFRREIHYANELSRRRNRERFQGKETESSKKNFLRLEKLHNERICDIIPRMKEEEIKLDDWREEEKRHSEMLKATYNSSNYCFPFIFFAESS